MRPISRLYDRILAFGCKPTRFSLLYPDDWVEEYRERTERDVRQRYRGRVSEGEMERLVKSARSGVIDKWLGVGHEAIDPEDLRGLPVVVADEAGEYLHRLEHEQSISIEEITTTLAPPFDRFFMELQGVPNSWDLNAWGFVVRPAEADDLPGSWDDWLALDPGWLVALDLVVEQRKNEVMGPVAKIVIALDRQGNWLRDNESLMWVAKFPRTKAEAEYDSGEGDEKWIIQSSGRLTAPILMAVSLMHCRNVTSETVEPSEARSKSWEKRRGQPLTRYEVLRIDPMRKILDSEGQAQSTGLRHALHICRGHFKTFGEEAPLFGRVAGTFWWADHVRGDRKEGRVIKDYEVAAPQDELGRPYEEAEEEPELARHEHTGPDPDAAGRGLAAHNRTQNQLAAAVVEGGLRPRKPSPDEPKYDLAWMAADKVCVAEVKSMTEQNEERQLRNALGQVVRYRQQLGGPGRVQGVIAVERQPADASWLELCNEEGVILCWPELFNLAVRFPEELTRSEDG